MDPASDSGTPDPLRIGLVADIHDHVHVLRPALQWLREHSDVLIVLGDLVAPFVMKQLGTDYPFDVHVVFGNNDGDQHRLVATAAGFGHVRVHGELFRHALGGRTIIAQHYPTIADVIDSSAADLVAFGHDHRARCSRPGDAYFVNPGALMGYDPLVDAEVPCSWAVYDSGAHAVAFWRLEDGAVRRWEIPGLPPAPPATS